MSRAGLIADTGEVGLGFILSLFHGRRVQRRHQTSGLLRQGGHREWLRVTASTILNLRGYDPDVIESAPAHHDPDVIRRMYNRAT
jgi:hypothetical protein